ncbi:hypothetical protein A200_05222 [Parascardovia denticolens IPLA 20019]|uniref:GTPase n=1 Tax=Parascardovia denticolens TaxID=78258 RepID=UPI0002669E1F|nr:GTPase [Parascardovia denticolens]EIT87953.1 hypothetical protein A200_05222 [Parascardovia denticolens IPLA 20019]
MSKQFSLDIPEYSERSAQLIAGVHELYEEIGCNTSILPKSAFDSDKPISLVFAGQYSAGKSTIVKALTGLEIATGHEITTEKAQAYDWHGIRVVDTPGIGTGRRPDHDEISYKAISDADLLVYVVTYAGFDDLIARDFRELLIDWNKSGEMVLVVNKMKDADKGNSLEQREVIFEDLAKVTKPLTPDQVRTVFVDALAYLKSEEVAKEKPERAARLQEQSNFAELVDTLNSFVEERGMAGRLTTPLYQLRNSLDATLQDQKVSSGDKDVDALEEQLLRERSMISNAMHDIEAAVKQIYRQTCLEIRDEGRHLADAIEECTTESDAEDLAEKSYSHVDSLAEDCGAKINNVIQERYEKCQDNLDEFYASEFVQDLQIRLEAKQQAGNPIVGRILQPDLIAQGSRKVVSKTIGQGAAGLRTFVGSPVHEAVLEIGHFFGHSFKPWEAVKWVRGINFAGKALGVFGVVLSFGLQAKEDYDSKKRQQEMRANRESVRASFNEVADKLETQYADALRRLLNESEVFQPRIDAINKELDGIRDLRRNKSVACDKLLEAIKGCQKLIEDVRIAFPK